MTDPINENADSSDRSSFISSTKARYSKPKLRSIKHIVQCKARAIVQLMLISLRVFTYFFHTFWQLPQYLAVSPALGKVSTSPIISEIRKMACSVHRITCTVTTSLQVGSRIDSQTNMLITVSPAKRTTRPDSSPYLTGQCSQSFYSPFDRFAKHGKQMRKPANIETNGC